MEINIKIKTPGTYLSIATWAGINRDINKILRRGLYDGLIELYPDWSKSLLKKRIKRSNFLYITDMNKGSWVIDLAVALGGFFVGTIFVFIKDITVDIIKNNSDYENLREYVNTNISKKIAPTIKKLLDEKKRIGPYLVNDQKSVLEKKKDGTLVLRVELELHFRREPDEINLDNTKSIEQAGKEIKNKIDIRV
jgi:hypothetical protein